MANGERYMSRKWILTKYGLMLYTGVHILNAVMILAARWKHLLPAASIEPLWAGSLTVWSVGVGAIIAIYMTGNVAGKLADNRGGNG